MVWLSWQGSQAASLYSARPNLSTASFHQIFVLNPEKWILLPSVRSIFHSKELQGPALNRQLESWPFHRTAFYRPFHLPNDRTHVLSSHCNTRRYLRPSNKYLIGKKCIWIRQRAFTGRLILSTSFHSWLCLLKHQKFNHKLFEMIYTLSIRILNKL